MWSVSTDNDSTFVARAIPYLRTMVQSERLVVQTTPYNEAPSTAIFDLTGVADALAPVAETCEWTLDPEQARLEREQQEQARRAAERRREQERQAERERILTGLLDRPITSGLSGPIGGTSLLFARLSTPTVEGRLQFVGGTSMAALSRARETGSYRISCSQGEWYGDEVVLQRCRLSE